jgi:hypothetical protein
MDLAVKASGERGPDAREVHCNLGVKTVRYYSKIADSKLCKTVQSFRDGVAYSSFAKHSTYKNAGLAGKREGIVASQLTPIRATCWRELSV